MRNIRFKFDEIREIFFYSTDTGSLKIVNEVDDIVVITSPLENNKARFGKLEEADICKSLRNLSKALIEKGARVTMK